MLSKHVIIAGSQCVSIIKLAAMIDENDISDLPPIVYQYSVS